MLSKEVQDWVASEKSKGYSKEQISYFLTQRGFDKNEVYNYLNQSMIEKHSNDHISRHANKHFWIVLIILFAIIIISGSLIYFLVLDNDSSNNSEDEEGFQEANLGNNQIPLDQNTESEEVEIIPDTNNLELESSNCEELIDCGSAKPMNECFVEAARNCCPAVLESSLTLDFFGVEVSTSMDREIIGLENNRCVVSQKILSSESRFTDNLKEMMLSSGLSEEEIASQEKETDAEGKKTVGQEGICKYPIVDLVKSLEDEIQGEYLGSTKDQEAYQCSGSLYEPQEQETTMAEGVSVN